MNERSAAFDVLCIGGANVDGDFRLTGPTILGTSNPASAEFAFGGVARNVAEDLARLGCRVALATTVGTDAVGRDLVDATTAAGVDTRYVRIAADAPTSRYVALHADDGEFLIGVNSMALIDGISVAELAGLPYDEARWIFADTNLSPEALGSIVERRRAGGAFRLAIDAVAVPKVERLPTRLDGVDVLFANADEANAILDRDEPGTPDGAAALARGLRSRGASAVSVSIGRDGVVVATASGAWHVGIVPVGLVNTSGAGDARIAGTLHGLLAGAPLQLAARDGSLAAALTAESPSAIDPELTPERFAAQAPRLGAVVITQVD